MIQFLKKLAGKEWRIGLFDRIHDRIEAMRLAEKSVWYIAFFIFTLSSLALLAEVNSRFLVHRPAHGGTLAEGIVGTPRFINPLLAISDADKDLTSLLYSGLMRTTPEGTFVPDLAESYTVSDDGLTYTFTLREDLEWSDGEPITADDVEFTVLKAQDPDLKSHRRANWEGIAVSRIDERQISFALSQPYALFLENATMGILPKHIWQSVETDEFPFSQWNIEPIGSGPFEVKNIERGGSGVPVLYELRARKGENAPYIERLLVRLYPNESAALEAHESGDIASLAGIGRATIGKIGPSDALRQSPLSRLFGIFFNQNQNEALLDKGARQALAAAIDKDMIVREVLGGFGTVADGPIPPKRSEDIAPASSAETASTSAERAIEILVDSGWEKDETTGLWEKQVNGAVRELSLSLSTSNIPELVETARLVEAAWKEIGVGVDVRIFEISDLNQNVIRPRKYDALLFGTVVTDDADLYAFWHSSQRNDPGLNIALYTNPKADGVLEVLRQTGDPEIRGNGKEVFEEEIASDIPAIFLYAPDFVYVLPKDVQGVELGSITASSDRFRGIRDWYVETESVWKIFAKEDTADRTEEVETVIQ